MTTPWRSPTILGLNVFHADSAACLLADGRLVAAVAEERLNRVKHFAGFPERAIGQCLEMAGLVPEEIDAVAVGRDAWANWPAKLGYALAHPWRVSRAAGRRLHNRRQLAGLGARLAECLDLDARRLKIMPVEHHLAHAAGAFYVSPFDRAAILTADGFGDFASTLTAVGEGTRIRVLSRTRFPHSLGILYTAICQFIGFDGYGDEGKVMGLAPYGRPTYLDFLRRLVRLKRGGRFQLDLDYFLHHREGVDYTFDASGRPRVAPLYSRRLEQALGRPRRRHADLTPRDLDLAASLQQVLEEAYLHILNHLYERTRLEALCLAGGVALNSVANGKIFDQTPFRHLYTQPAAGDDGTALGAACYLQHAVLGRPRRFVMEHAYFGPSFPESRVRVCLAQAHGLAGACVRRLDERTLIRLAAEALAAGRIVGWFQGAAEWGPRALGNRSILAHPGWPGIKDVLNARVKHREAFRPFAPSILAERTAEYFQCDHPSPFMMLVYKTRPEVRARIAAVNHVDDTGRLQTVLRAQNPRYYDLIAAFERLTGLPLLLNTSFNENEPIVTTPEEALDCFRRTRIDVLVMGDWCVERASAEASLGRAAA